jgi:hypothetical protein
MITATDDDVAVFASDGLRFVEATATTGAPSTPALIQLPGGPAGLELWGSATPVRPGRSWSLSPTSPAIDSGGPGAGPPDRVRGPRRRRQPAPGRRL